MSEDIIYRKMRRGEENRVFDIVKTGFDEYVLPDMTEEGTQEFFRAARDMIFNRPSGHFILVGESKARIIGMIDMKNAGHICLFFVAKTSMRKGIGRALLEHAVADCIAADPGISKIDVNSSLFAVPVYEKLGFLRTANQQRVNGIRFVPMIKTIQSKTTA